MSVRKLVLPIAFLCPCLLTFIVETEEAMNPTSQRLESIAMKLPQPRPDGPLSLEKTLLKRRSIREFRRDAVELSDVSQLLWAAQGISDPRNGRRTAPSAGALYPLEVYVVAGNVNGLGSGVYKYEPKGHALTKIRTGDVRNELYRAALEQQCVKDAAVVVVLSAVFERTSVKYRQRTERYVHMEVGHAAQNVLLQAVSLGLGSVPVGAFDDALIKEVVQLQEKEVPLYLLPVGKP